MNTRAKRKPGDSATLAQTPSWEQVFEYPGAKAAADELISGGFDPKVLLQALCWQLHWQDKPAAKEHAEIPGIPSHTLKRLPERLEGIAGQIEKINAHHYYDPKRSYMGSVLEQDFSRLPKALRDYSFYLAVQRPFNSEILRSIHMSLENGFLVGLLNVVELITNRKSYKEVSTLLNAVFRASGLKRKLTPGALRTLRTRRRELRLDIRK